MKLSEALRALLSASADQPIKLEQLLQQTGDKGFGMILGVLSLLMVIPIPVPLAGFSTLIGAGMILMGGQIMRGDQQPFLPKRIARITISAQASKRLLDHLNRVLRPLEWIAKPRLSRLSHHRLHRVFMGLCLIWNAILLGLPLPIPFTNIVPGFTNLMFAIALLEADGVMILLGYALTVATTCFFVSISGLIWNLVQSLWA